MKMSRLSSVVSSITDDLMSEEYHDNMCDVQTMVDDYSVPGKNESVVARSSPRRGQHKCLDAVPSQFPALEVQ